MIPVMDAEACSCCESFRPVVAMVRRRTARRGPDREFMLPAVEPICSPICRSCLTWLSDLIRHQGASPVASAPLLGVPVSGGRVRVFPDQCHFCKEVIGAQGVAVDAIALPDAARGMDPVLVCDACDIWLAGLATDGRSARGEVHRAIDGVYGMWPHPNLRNLAAEIAVSDEAAANAIRECCYRMGVRVVGQYNRDAVLFVRASESGLASTVLEGEHLPRPGRIVLASLAAREDLIASLERGATTWITVPVTPQQISAALTTALRRRLGPPSWDRETALPVLDLQHLDRPALAIVPVAGVTPYEAAWFTRRVSRGYDDLGVYGAQIILVPRVASADFDRVLARLARALEGKCTVSVLQVTPTLLTSRPRLEAAG